jgi:electron transport complex protein RnfE
MNNSAPYLQSLLDHPVIATALGVAPLVVMVQTLLSAAVMSLSFSAALILSMLSVSLIRRLIPSVFRLPFILLISSSWVTVIDILLQTYFYEMRISLDVYVPLIAMNSLLLWMLEENSLKRSIIVDIVPALSTCTLVIIICLVSGGGREFLTQGRLLSDMGLIFPQLQEQTGLLVIPAWNMPVLATPSGALLILGCVLAGMNLALSKLNKADTESQTVPDTDSGADGFEH